MSHFRPWDILNTLKNSVRFKGGGGSDPNPNLISDSTKKQWEIQAKQWNDFVGTYEPRIDYAQGILTKDRKSTRLNSSHLKLSRMPSSA